jgi:hypothetical protein
MKNIFMITAIVATLLLSSCTGQPEKPDKTKFSGYLTEKYYEGLTRADTPSGQAAYRYIAPDFKASNYNRAMIDPVVIFPEPKPTEQVSEKTITTLQTKMTNLISNSFSRVLPLTKSSAKGVLRVQTAITGVDVSNKDLEGYEYIPIALIVSGVSYALGARDQEVNLYLETRITDSVTHKVLAVGVRQISGEDLENAKTRLEANQLNEGLKKAGEDFIMVLKNIFAK